MSKRIIQTLLVSVLCFTWLMAYNTNVPTPFHATKSDSQPKAIDNNAIGKNTTRISILWPGKPDISAQNDRIVAEIEKRTGITLEFISQSTETYEDTMNFMAVSGNLPDIITMIDHTNQTLLDMWVKGGIIIPFSNEMLAAAPEIVKEYQQTEYYKDLMIDGKIYFQPIFWDSIAEPNMGLFHVRKDILDKLGIKPPDTLEGIRDAMEKMHRELGIYGLVYSGKIPHLSAIAGAFGLPYNGWVKDDKGNYVYANVQPHMKEALRWLKQLYQEQLIDPESSILTQDQAEERYFSGAAGFIIFNGGAHIARYQDSISKIDPNGQEYLLPAPAGPDGKRGYVQEPSFWGVTAVSSNCKNPVAAAKLLNFLLSQEGQTLTAYGIEGIHYVKTSDGTIILNQEERAKEGQSHWDRYRYHVTAAPIVSWVNRSVQDWYSLYGKDKSYIDWYYRMRENQIKYQTINEAMVLSTPKWAIFAKTSKDLTEEYFYQMITGKMDIDKGFEEYVKKWNDAGGAEASLEMNDAIKKARYK